MKLGSTSQDSSDNSIEELYWNWVVQAGRQSRVLCLHLEVVFLSMSFKGGGCIVTLTEPQNSASTIVFTARSFFLAFFYQRSSASQCADGNRRNTVSVYRRL